MGLRITEEGRLPPWQPGPLSPSAAPTRTCGHVLREKMKRVMPLVSGRTCCRFLCTGKDAKQICLPDVTSRSYESVCKDSSCARSETFLRLRRRNRRPLMFEGFLRGMPALDREIQRSKSIRELCRDSGRVANLLQAPIISFPRCK